MSDISPKRSPRRWLQFRLSTILLVVLLCAVAAIWQRHRIEVLRLQTQLEETRRSQQDLSAALEKLEADLSLLRTAQQAATYRDRNGIIRTLDGRPVGIWGVDNGDIPANSVR